MKKPGTAIENLGVEWERKHARKTQTSRRFQIIVVFSAAISLLVALKLITKVSEPRGPEGTVTAPVNSVYLKDTNLPHTWKKKEGNAWKQFNQGEDVKDFGAMDKREGVETITVTYDLGTPREKQLIGIMNHALTNSATPIKADQRTLRQLVLARVKGDWSTVPKGPDWADNEMWQRHSANMLKRNIGYLLSSGTTNVVIETDQGTRTNTVPVPASPETIERVLKADVGTEVPPMDDYEVHE